MHFDERLDAGLKKFAPLTYGQIQPQVFRRAFEADEGPVGLRRVTMEPLAVSFLEGSPYELHPMFAELDALEQRVQAASESLVDFPSV
jgi:hypothetical protein